MPKKEKEVKEKKQKNSYFKEMKAELKKVVWPTPKELFNTTVSVLAFVIIIAVIVFVLDFCFDAMNKYGITKFQEAVKSSTQSEEDTNNADETNTTDGETEGNSDENSNNGDESTDGNVVEENSVEEGSTEENVAE